MSMGPEHWAILLLMLGFLLLVAEVFLPSGGLIFVMAFSCLAGAGWCAWKAWWISQPTYFGIFIACEIFALPATAVIAFKIWNKRLDAEDETTEQMTRTAPNSELMALVGKRGEAITPLNPSGLVNVEEQRIHASSEGMIIARGQAIDVIAIQGNHLIVRISEKSTETEANDIAPSADLEEDDRLDFDVAEE